MEKSLLDTLGSERTKAILKEAVETAVSDASKHGLPVTWGDSKGSILQTHPDGTTVRLNREVTYQHGTIVRIDQEV